MIRCLSLASYFALIYSWQSYDIEQLGDLRSTFLSDRRHEGKPLLSVELLDLISVISSQISLKIMLM